MNKPGPLVDILTATETQDDNGTCIREAWILDLACGHQSRVWTRPGQRARCPHCDVTEAQARRRERVQAGDRERQQQRRDAERAALNGGRPCTGGAAPELRELNRLAAARAVAR